MKLHPYQTEGVQRILSAPMNRYILSYGTGTGKTPTAATAAKALNPQSTLVVCPAMVRRHWQDEFARWADIEAAIIEFGTGRKLSSADALARSISYAADTRIVSYSLIEECLDTPTELIIFDECHRLQNPTSKWSEHAHRLIAANPGCAIIGLSATIAPDNVGQVYGPLHAIWPGRFGTQSRFKKRYMLWEERQAGGRTYPHYYGAQNSDELAIRLASVSHRVTREDVAHLLPAFDVSSLVIERKPHQTFLLGSEKELLLRSGQEKLSAVTRWEQDAQKTATHRCIAVHHKSLARELALTIEGAVLVTGDQNVQKRSETLRDCKNRSQATIVVTMDSTGIGIDLTWCTEVLIAELVYRPEQLVQFLGRFSRLSGKVPASVKIMLIEGTLDEIIADKVLTKLDAVNSIIKPDQGQTVLGTVLDIDSENWLEELEEALR